MHTSNNCGIDWLARYAFASSIDILNALQIYSLHNTRPNSSVKTTKRMIIIVVTMTTATTPSARRPGLAPLLHGADAPVAFSGENK